MSWMFILRIIVLIGCFTLTAGQCTLPSTFASSTWVDSARGDLVFTDTTMTGWPIIIDSSTTISTWQCAVSDQFDTDGYLVLRSVNDFIQFVTSRYYAYLCLKLTKITDVSYRYYIYEPKQFNIDSERLLVLKDGSHTTTTSTCYESFGASGSEYQIMVKSGSESSAGITCPWTVLGKFNYEHQSASTPGTTTCSSGNNLWDICSDKTEMDFDFTACTTDVPYSGLTAVTCVDSVPVGTDNFVTVYTDTSVDGVNTFMFACFGISEDLTSASVAPQHCREGQTPTSYPVNNVGVQLGAIITITEVYEICPTCPALVNPDGGSVYIETNGAGTTGYYTCAEEYALYGDSDRLCQRNNTWAGAAPVCKCKAPASPSNGNVSVSSDGSVATYTCNIGYVLTGNAYRICQTDGNAWNGTDPTCETCDALGDLNDGTVIQSQQGSTSLATFNCDVGYTLDGASSITCNIDGTWSGSFPTCVACTTPVSPTLGSYTLSSDGQQTTVTFVCSSGYQISGHEILTCLTDGLWNATEPTCICETPSSPDFGSVSLSADGTVATYACNNGYTLNGDVNRTCSLTGSSWSGNAPSCESCIALTTPSGGNITMATDGTTTSATYTCLSGYTMIGDQSTTCNVDGTWTQSSTTCVSCQVLAAPTSGSVNISTNGTTSIATYSCSSGYTIAGSSTRTCQTDATWDSTQPTCSCETLSAPANGDVSITDGTASFTCTVNYTLVGNSHITCLADGSGWNGSQPTCVECDTISTVSGGSVQLVSGTGLYTEAAYTCDVGYSMAGSSLLVCGTSGTWDNLPPTCVQCQTLQQPSNGTVTFTSDGQTTSASFTCDVGFTASVGSAAASQCNDDGSWSNAAVTCVECSSLNEIASGSTNVSTNGTFTYVTYACSSGYILIGESSRTCLNDGSWSDSEPACQCETPAAIPDGAVAVAADGITAIYSCDSGFSLNGESAATCQTDGTGWSIQTPTCVQCDTLNDPTDGLASQATNGTHTIATYMCSVGYTVNGSNVRTCEINGQWTADPPNCVECVTLGSVSSGSISLSFNVTSTLALFSCVNGYSLQGTSLLTCGSDGAWDTDPPSCICDSPSHPTNGSVAVSSDGYTATYTCEIGYSISGDVTRVCQTDGSSWSGNAPVCVTCTELQSTTGSSTVLSTNGTTTGVLYSCGVGYSMDGIQSRVCSSDGSWSEQEPVCAVCDALANPSSGSTSLSTNGSVTSAAFSCVTNYYIHGEISAQCGTTGIWSAQVPSCICVLPSSPANGSMSVSSDNMTLTFTCEAGYILSGSFERTCGADGSGWSGSQPSCIMCDSLESPTNGALAMSTDGIVTKSVYTCNSGSTLYGPSTLTCEGSGTWDLSPPVCVTCPALDTPSSGTTTVTTNGTISEAVFTCVGGYSIEGDAVITCQTNGTWTGDVPLCKCNSPTTPTNGLLTLSTDGMQVDYECDVGSTLSGVSQRLCSIDGTGWDGADPQCVSCPTLTSPTAGALNTSTTGTATTGMHTCNVGYTMDGEAVLTCQTDGSWDNNSPSCVECPSLPGPDSGSVSLSTTGVSTEASFTCVAGYYISGDVTATCLSDGTWSTAEPSCVCSPPSTPTDGALTLSSNGMTVTYTCTAGYTLLGVSTRICQTDGTGWNEDQPSCTICSSLSNPSGGDVQLVTSGTTTQALFTCDAGYTITGSGSLSCRSDGSWDFSAPTCSACTSLSSPAGGSVSMSTDGATTTANFTCTVGYTLVGSGTLSCRADGSWDFSSPTCVKCSTLTSPDSGTLSLSTDGVTSTAAVSCTTGYYVNGEDTLTCDTDGLWDNAVATCLCNSPSASGNGSITISSDGMSVTYACDIGFSMVGTATTSCSTDGSGWTTGTPSCVSCPTLLEVNDGTIDTITNGTSTTSSVTCSLGTSLSGTPSTECTGDGTWTFEQPACSRCPNATAADNGSVDLQTNGTVTTAMYSCDVGYTMAGVAISTCQSDGSWTTEQPACALCDSLNAISSGDATSTTNGSFTVAAHVCDTGYYVDGSVEITCLSDGTWSNNQPNCVCNPPSAPTNGNIWVSTDGITVQYSCDVGYTLNGDANNTCGTGGTGWMNNQPTCVQCQTTVVPLNGDVQMYTDGTGTYSVTTCDEGYSVSSATNVIQCQDTGLWSTGSLSCVQCETISAPDSGYVSTTTNGSASKATYSCMTGYTLQGTEDRTCQVDGTWDLTAPFCVCKSPSEISNGVLTVSADLLTATYTCNSGYSLNGVTTQQCQTDGTGWSDKKPTCVTCSTLSNVPGGSVALWTDGVSTFANFSCATGYTMEGESSIQCRNDGTWNISQPTCVICTSVTPPSGGSAALVTDGLTTSVIFECGTGYTLVGSTSSTCASTGSWSSTEPDCIVCSTLIDPESGTVVVSSNGSRSTATFQCNNGYHIVGASIIQCTGDGTWDQTEPYCVCDGPTTPANGLVVLTDSNYTAGYSCDEGFSLSGNGARTCNRDGTGWSGSDPACVQCDTLSAPTNGSLTTTTDGTTTSVTVGCDVGLTSSGVANLTCLNDGTFDYTVPQCVECDSLLTLANGATVLSSTGSVTGATFTCSLGFFLNGVSSSTCLTDGSWTDASPICEQCASFQDVDSGTFTMSTNGTTTAITVVCDTGYALQGQSVVECSGTGSWTDIPICVCETPSAPENGNVTSDGTQATFTCDIGYSLNGVSSSQCQSGGGGWNSVSPSCVTCETVANISIGGSQTTTDGSSTHLTYTCPTGYTIDGADVITCSADGTWSESLPSCTLCDSLDAPDSGSVTIATNDTMTSASYACASGYDLVGNSINTCTHNGSWTFSPPNCYCASPDIPLNGGMEVSSDRSTASFTCDTGYTLHGVEMRTCQTDGSGWTGQQPTCNVCSTLNVPSGGQVAIVTDGTTTTATFSCNSGYSMDGETSLVCRSDGSWNTSVPTCVSCEAIVLPSGGSYTVSTDSITSTVTYTCDEGYTLSGNSQSPCSTSGLWQSSPPVCSSCKSLAAPSSGTFVTSTNGTVTSATFSCVAGYYISGESVITCGTDGDWNFQEPDCLCDPLSDITNGAKEISVNQSVVSFSCDEGFSINGSSTRSCQDNGLGWSGTQPTCTACSSVSPPVGGSLLTLTDGSMTSLSFGCDVGYSIYGEAASGCGSDGTWTYEAPTCVSCPTLTAPGNGNISITTNGTLTIAEYICQLGYTMDGMDSAVCQVDGSWSSDAPACVMCSTLDPVNSGGYDLTTDGSVTSSTFYCVNGYDAKGISVLTCRTDGTWDDSQPTCVCSPPLSIVNGNYTISTNGMAIEYTCSIGYTMVGSASRSCDSSGSGWTGTAPTCSLCETLPLVDNGAVFLQTDGTSTTVIYRCEVGYSVSGEYLDSCNTDGSWNVSAPSCVVCPSLSNITNGYVSMVTNGAMTSATYQCLTGYTLVGYSDRSCSDGSWNGTAPTCVCSYSTFFANGEVSSDGLTISYTCTTGYTLNGTSQRICQDDGTGWDLTEPQCVSCETLSTPTGGSLALSSDGAETKAAFTCSSGYTMTGNIELTCKTDGTWDSEPPSCGVPCSSLSIPSGGDVTVSTDGMTTTALYTCESQYTLVGVSSITCRSDGTWDFTESSCAGCSDLTAPTNGYVNITSDTATSTAAYTCHSGYYLDGEASSTCSSDGTWDSSAPTCICDPPSNPDNGLVQVINDGQSATFTCVSGYTLVGEADVTCGDDSSGWSANNTLCVSCGVAPQLSNGSVSTVTNGTVASLVFSCDNGYTMKGNASVSCSSDGSWETDFPECVSCLVLSDLENGSSSTTTDGQTTSIQYYCDLGFTLSGDNSISCQSDGTWSASQPTCVSCPVLAILPSGENFEYIDGTATVTEFSCFDEYYLVGEPVIGCQTSGSWNGTVPTCVCDAPDAPVNGSVSLYAGGMSITYTCLSGFTLSGVSERQCSVDGTGWTDTAPTCVQCQSLSALANGDALISTNGTETKAYFTCEAGYTLAGVNVITCSIGGTWSASVPSCVLCDTLSIPSSGAVSISTNGSTSKADYTCVVGYTVQGQGERTCGTDGMWDYENPLCICETPSTPANGNVAANGTTAVYSCEAGYTLHGAEARVCQGDGLSWNGTDPTCTACSALTSVSGGSVALATDGSQTSASYICDTGYTISGSSTLTCRSDGSWDFTDTTCVSCDSLVIPDNGALSTRSDGSITSANFTCNVGYTLTGSAQLTCKADGGWDFTEPFCELCLTLDNPTSGSVILATDGTTSSAAYTCVSGYHLDGPSTRTCESNGIWTGDQPSCKCDVLAVPGNGSMTTSNNGAIVTFECDTGFSLAGSTVLVCQSDGTGWNGSTPSCSQCAGFSEVANGSIAFVTDGQTTSVEITCDVGSTLSGYSSIACLENGTWDVQTGPTCEVCPEMSNPEGGTVTVVTDGTTTRAHYVCETGYSLDGQSELQCTDTNVWSSDPPSCALCASAASPASGSVTLSTDGNVTVATYACVTDYYIIGDNPVNCLTDGSWNNVTPRCACIALNATDNGKVSISSDSMGLQFECSVGYSLIGTDVAACVDDGSGWDITAPTCVSCPTLLSISNGYVVESTNGTVSVATYYCNAGFTLLGDNVRECNATGTWTLDEPTCVACPTLDTIPSGSVNITSDGLVSKAYYSCESDYDLQGVDWRECLTDGSWNSSQPSCTCQLPATPLNGAVEFGTDVSISKYTCTTGYTLYGTFERHCQEDGTGWNGSAPACVVCETLSSSAGSSVTLSTDGSATSATYDCDVGYTMTGERTLRCRDDGTWDLEPASCVICNTLNVPDGGLANVTSAASVTMAAFTCTSGYSLTGAATLTCRTDGSWDFVEPSCVKCPELSEPLSGHVTVSTDSFTSTATYSCTSAYYLSGSSTLTCNTDAAWDNNPPLCICEAPPSIDNGSVAISSDGMSVIYTCYEGYTMDGNSSRACATDGSWWDGSAPYCVKCPAASSPTDGSLTFSTDGMTTLLSFTCDQGFSMNGVSQIHCLSDGAWDNQPPTCDACAGIVEPTNSTMTFVTNGTTTSAEFVCEVGFTLIGQAATTCTSGGIWDFTEPTCEQCSSLSNPENGIVSITTNGTVTMATYYCISGYSLTGEVNMWCSIGGVWNNSPPVCECDSFTTPSNGDIQIYDNGTKASFTCDTGYTLSGDIEQECVTTSSLSSSTSSTCRSCEQIVTPSGASVVLTSDGTITTAMFNCDVGYNMIGQNTLTCRNDGTWDIATPSCVTCTSLILPTGGAANLTTDGSSTLAEFTCEPGYTLLGSKTLTCRTDGSWDFSEPTCVKCSDLSNPASGSVAISTDGYTTTATFTCASAYSLDGDNTLVCNSSAVWNNEPPACKCDAPPSIDNGTMVISADGGNVQYTCDMGFSVDGGDTVRTCGTDGSWWNGTVPICVKCNDITNVANGSFTYTSDGETTSVLFTCVQGFSLNGVSMLQCQSDGSWDNTQPTCAPCDTVLEPANSTLTFVTNGTSTSAMFKCDAGFSAAGQSDWTCTAAGTWEGDPLSCVQCSSLGNPENGEVSITTNGSVTMATYSCYSGYGIVGSTDLYCTIDGAWSTSAPVCECQSFSTPSNGDIQVYDNGTKASYTCDTGYTLTGEVNQDCAVSSTISNTNTPPTCTGCETLNITTGALFSLASDGTTTTAIFSCGEGYSLIGQTTLTCRSDGTWDVVTPTCVTCSSLDLPTGAAVNITTDGSSTTADFSCETGYTIVGPKTLTCRTDGSWDLNEPTCVQCPSLVDPHSGQVTVSTDGYTSTATYSCTSGYELDGSSVLTCNTSALWDEDSPVCKCTSPPDIDDGTMTISTDGMNVQYTCDVGFTLDGDAFRTCGSDGTLWNGSTPVCMKCDEQIAHSNGTSTYSTDGTTTSLSFTCDQGMSMNGMSQIYCQSDGTWDNPQPTCDQCAAITEPENSILMYVTNGTTTSAVFECGVGFTIEGHTETTCTTGGSWDIDVPTCVECPTFDNPNNGEVSFTTNGSVTIATYSCSAGYQLVGASILYCGTDGAWSNSPSACECDSFTTPSNGDIHVSDNGTTASFTCGVGYTLSGEVQQDCVVTSSLSSTTSPTCTGCESLDISAGATFTLTTDGTTTTTVYGCDVGYNMIGQSTLTCRSDGTWDIETPSCVTCATLQVPTGGYANLTTDGSDTTAVFSCEAGYTLVGSRTLSCRTDASWDFSEPTCVKCPEVSNPSSGEVALSTDATTSTAVYSCMSGYYIDGEATLTCNTSGSWSYQSPLCLCTSPTTIDNGELVTSNGGMFVQYSCNTQYSLNGTANRTCGTDGSAWSGEAPSCVKCTDIATHANGSTSTFTDGLMTSVMFTCDQGYSLTGESTLQCLPDGNWDNAQPTCEKCSDITEPANSILTFVNNGTTTSAVFGCDVGFTMIGTTEATCTSGGIWDIGTPTCVQCPSPTDIDNGAVSTTTNGSTTLASFSCLSGYSLVGGSQLYCTMGGIWSDDQPSCECDSFVQPSNGDLVVSSNGTMATYVCGEGYTMAGESVQACSTTDVTENTSAPICTACESLTVPAGSSVNFTTDGTATTAIFTCNTGHSIDGSSVLTCRSDGSWDIVTPTCVTCSVLSVPTGGNVVFNTDGSITSAGFTCDVEYSLTGASALTCLSGGSWDLSEPTCTKCSTLTQPASGNMLLSTDGHTTSASFGCSSGYYIDGVSDLKCDVDGTWDNDVPVCKCIPPSTFSNGSITLNSDDSTLFYTCFNGYTLDGVSERLCDDNGGGWIGNAPVCVKCEVLASAANTSLTLSTDGSATTVTVECDNGYSLSGVSEMTCGVDGTWADQQPTCVSCTALVEPNNGGLIVQSNGTTTTMVYHCDAGYTLDGTSEATCLSDGTWTSEKPNCVICTAFEHPLNGNVQITSNGSVTYATFSCLDGYSVSGQAVTYCGSNGVYESVSPTCDCDIFLNPSNGNITVASNGTKATYTCDVGYTLNGEAEQDCSSTSTSTSSVACIPCDTLFSSAGSSIAISSSGILTSAFYTCDVGYTINGEKSLTCLSDGSWNIQSPDCIVCQTLEPGIGLSVNLATDGSITTATITCVTGFTLVGEEELTCRADGSWDFEIPSCVCDVPLIPSNGAITLSVDGLEVAYECDVGYTLSGSDLRHCFANGTWWQGSDPVCIKCSELDIEDSINITLLSDGTTTTVSFYCNAGYTISHNRNVTCSTNGSWDEVIPSCVKCSSLSATNALSYQLLTDGLTTTSSFTCAGGYTHSGPTVRTCSGNGTWNLEQPTCSKIDETVPEDSRSSDGAAIGLGIMFALATIAAIILGILAWRYWKLYNSLGGGKANNYTRGNLTSPNDSLRISDFDKVVIASPAPVSHQQHVTELGRTLSSLAPAGYTTHMLEKNGFSPIQTPASLSIRGVDRKTTPGMYSRASRKSPNPSFASTSLSGFRTPLPQQILTLQEDEFVPNVRKHSKVKKGKSEAGQSTQVSKSSDKPVKKSPKSSLTEPPYRDGSPLPQQILTPRNASDSEPTQNSRNGAEKTGKQRKKKRNPDFIDKDSHLLKVMKNAGQKSPVFTRAHSPGFQQFSHQDIEHDVSDVEA